MSLRYIPFAALLLCSIPAFAVSAPGINNFDRVDAHVYRGGQPTTEGFRYLAGIGVRTIIDLRESSARSTKEEQVVTAAGMKYINVPMTDLTPPTRGEITKILDVLENASGGPVFVHCLHGADRTGAVIAAYHIDHENWDNARALRDAKAHRMSIFQFPRQNFIKTFQARSRPADNKATAPLIPAVILRQPTAVAR